MNALLAVLLLEVAAAAPATRPVVVCVRDSSKVPVHGARIVVDGAASADRALAELLAKRAGASKEDGLLDLGALPIDQPIALRVGAPGFRAGTLKLPAGFEAGRRDVVLAPNQDVEVRISGLARKRGEARPEVTLAQPDSATGDLHAAGPPTPADRRRRPRPLQGDRGRSLSGKPARSGPERDS